MFLAFVACLTPQLAQAQSPTIPLNADTYHLIDRLEIKQGSWADGFHSTVKPYNRQSVVQLTDTILNNVWIKLSPADRFNLQYLRDDSWEWVPSYADSSSFLSSRAAELSGGQKQPGDSRKPLGPLYHKKGDFYSTQTENFDIHISPVVNFGYGAERNSDTLGARFNPFVNTRGLEVRGSIGKRLGFYTYLSDNQVLFSRYIQDYARDYNTNSKVTLAPGEGFTKLVNYSKLPYGNGYGTTDFLSARGYITFKALKIIDVQFGHDRNFFGNGFRSMLFSDNSAPYLFLKISTQLGRFQYTNLFTEFQNTQVPVSPNVPFLRKYAAMHHLSVNLGNHINLGFFEAEVFSRDQLELNYLNPIIFYRFVESYRGSADNALVGLDFKANFARHFLVYSQFMLDEFTISTLRAGNGSWTNKFAFQAGLKYIDAFGIPNLDLQGELNLARPYMYSHQSGQTNYVHYNQPLAHPLGANFVEGVGIFRYQPLPRWNVTGTFSVMDYGADPPSRNYGGNLLKSYDDRVARPNDVGHYIGQGRKTIVTYADLRLSFMLRHNFFVDLRQLVRNSNSQLPELTYNTSSTSFGLRWNLPYRNLVL